MNVSPRLACSGWRQRVSPWSITGDLAGILPGGQAIDGGGEQDFSTPRPPTNAEPGAMIAFSDNAELALAI